MEHIENAPVGNGSPEPSQAGASSLHGLAVSPTKDDRGTRAQALWDQLLRSQPGPTNDDLRVIIENVEPLREQAKRMLVPTTREVLEEIKSLAKHPH
jgi:hypothetical protein